MDRMNEGVSPRGFSRESVARRAGLVVTVAAWSLAAWLAPTPRLAATGAAHSTWDVATLDATPANAQGAAIPPASELLKPSADKLVLAPGGHANAQVTLAVLKGWHVNANPATDENSIATEVGVTGSGALGAAKALYPKPRIEKLSFSDQPLLVFDGETVVQVPISASALAKPGAYVLSGTVRFQACNDQLCLPPASATFEVPVEVNPAASSSTAPPAGAGSGGEPSASAGAPRLQGTQDFATAPPKGGGAMLSGGPLADLLNRGGWGAYLTLFLIGLALNLTPCVYPMIGVTVSIFGARRAAPPAQVVGSALLYVLGMAAMYTTLGVVAALTGGLFGGFLQSPLVLVGIGALLVALSLSMFGLYELQPPAALLTRIGGAGATSAIGVFASGLVVGVFAAPCIGPPIVALLAVVAARGDAWFGMRTFFTLALGLGFPYLLLATFSNLLSALPRSGEWMVWVKKVFGVILAAVGLNYALLALAPRLAPWVMPAALILGGLYLGFLERSASNRRGFRLLKWITGAAGVMAGAALIALTPASGVTFEAGTRAALGAALHGDQPVMIDFSADWCQPCHELERMTFTHPKVKDAVKGFRAFKVDLTRYDSPESEAWRREYQITGVPTVVFVRPGVGEVRDARVEGFLPPDQFIVRLATAR
jgi:thiol:disulfide interchange protein DsbD